MPKAKKGKVTHISIFAEKFLNRNIYNSDEYALRIFFSEVIGPKISKYAQLVKHEKDTVYIAVKNSVVKNEIMLTRRKIIKLLNEFPGIGKINEIKIVQN
ncbi:MAG: hypothetical protein A2474_03120 [Elusimicrobia bacterium RIFOXYC2_FULL_34_12]|nr:MAG: hypothetical protein A2474_03120 [Elusimicrobia bacterium RIFOXYC2_FULL_34_12]OGS38835.1 MAG: hypothetical protein A2551_03050 [Elusimicrobia bacterium RIFOXYD2_FULL_34_30]HAM38659.1 hypothetical protein [Elusimicrobiota bacterium]